MFIPTIDLIWVSSSKWCIHVYSLCNMGLEWYVVSIHPTLRHGLLFVSCFQSIHPNIDFRNPTFNVQDFKNRSSRIQYECSTIQCGSVIPSFFWFKYIYHVTSIQWYARFSSRMIQTYNIQCSPFFQSFSCCWYTCVAIGLIDWLIDRLIECNDSLEWWCTILWIGWIDSFPTFNVFTNSMPILATIFKPCCRRLIYKCYPSIPMKSGPYQLGSINCPFRISYPLVRLLWFLLYHLDPHPSSFEYQNFVPPRPYLFMQS